MRSTRKRILLGSETLTRPSSFPARVLRGVSVAPCSAQRTPGGGFAVHRGRDGYGVAGSVPPEDAALRGEQRVA
ncbi:hypothetical protein DIPPA_16614 [Diplonema papillatum]|nr:hypothetical protein DIPPA_16614 [Diplonema papillatum]